MLLSESEHINLWGENITIPILALDIVIFTVYKGELCLVLTKTQLDGKDGYAIPGGIIAKGFDLEKNFDDILERKTGIKGVYKEQLYTFGDPKRDPRGHVISVCYYALVSIDNFYSKIDFTKVDIIKYKDLDKIKLFFDHEKIIKYAKQRLEWKLDYTNIAREILPEKFRMSQLQGVYEIITGKEYDKRNFQKKIFSLGLLEDTKELDKTTNRPAKLYKFKDKDLKIVEENSFV